MAVQEGLTSIRVSWSPPTPLGDTTGYRIYYSGGSSGSVDVSDGSTDNYLLTGLQNGESYTISIVATSQHLPSESIAADMEVMLGEDIHVQVAVSVQEGSQCVCMAIATGWTGEARASPLFWNSISLIATWPHH